MQTVIRGTGIITMDTGQWGHFMSILSLSIGAAGWSSTITILTIRMLGNILDGDSPHHCIACIVCVEMVHSENLASLPNEK